MYLIKKTLKIKMDLKDLFKVVGVLLLSLVGAFFVFLIYNVLF